MTCQAWAPARASTARIFSAGPVVVWALMGFDGKGEGGEGTETGASSLRSLSQFSHSLHEAGQARSLPWPP